MDYVRAENDLSPSLSYSALKTFNANHDISPAQLEIFHIKCDCIYLGLK